MKHFELVNALRRNVLAVEKVINSTGKCFWEYFKFQAVELLNSLAVDV